MLVLSRKVGETILIGENIAITVVQVGQSTVRLGVVAPHEVTIVREELRDPARAAAREPRVPKPR